MSPFSHGPISSIYRGKNLKVGASGHRRMHHQMIRTVENVYRGRSDRSTRFYISFLDDDPRPDAAVIQALNNGASKIIVLELFLTISIHTAEGKKLIEELHAADFVPIHYTRPMYDSQTLKSMFPTRAGEHVGETAKSKVGILLIGHGQPDAWDKEWRSETAGENSFREDILDELVVDGYPRENINLAWMAFKEPKPAKMVEEFHARGLEKVLYFPTAISADTIHSQCDIPELIEMADVPVEFPVIDMHAWNNDPIVVQALVEKIDS